MNLSTAGIKLKQKNEVAELRRAGELVCKVFEGLTPHIFPGVYLSELDRIADELIKVSGGKSAYRNYQPRYAASPFPSTICTSVNSEVCHGLPTKRKLCDGDIVGIDVGIYFCGWAGDACITFPVGCVKRDSKNLLDTALQCLKSGVSEVRPGHFLRDIGAAIQEIASSHGYSVVKPYTGHGLGRALHELPLVPHWGRRGEGIELRPGMVFTIEPVINAGAEDIIILANNWTAVTKDNSLSAQFEYTVAVTHSGCEILTPWNHPSGL